MTKIPLASSDFRRGVSRVPDVLLRNRYVEPNPVLSDGTESYIARPGLRYWQTVGDGPIRAVFSQPGAFDDDLFVVSYNTLFRVARADGAITELYNGLTGGDERTAVRMAVTGDVGIITPKLWIADGSALYYYDDATPVTAVATPDTVGVIDVAVINGYVIVIPAQGEGINGRFYWVEPGAAIIDPLNFATAERSADPIYQCVVFSDQFWLPGQSTTEVWFMSGDPDAPVQRLQGVVFDRGTIAGTAIQIKNFMVLIDSDGGVFRIQGGETRISTPDIAERLRKALNEQNIISP